MAEEIKAIITDYPATEGPYMSVEYVGPKAVRRNSYIPVAHGPALRDALSERFPVTPPEPEAEPEPFGVWPRSGWWKVSRGNTGQPVAAFYYNNDSGVTKEDALAKATKLAEELNVEDRERKPYRLDKSGDRFVITKRDEIGGQWTVAVFYYDNNYSGAGRGVTKAGAEAEAKALLAKLNAKH